MMKTDKTKATHTAEGSTHARGGGHVAGAGDPLDAMRDRLAQDFEDDGSEQPDIAYRVGQGFGVALISILLAPLAGATARGIWEAFSFGWRLFGLATIAAFALAVPSAGAAISKADVQRAATTDALQRYGEMGPAQVTSIGCRKLRGRPDWRCLVTTHAEGAGDCSIVCIDPATEPPTAQWEFFEELLIRGRSCRRIRVIDDPSVFVEEPRHYNACAPS